MYYSLCFQLCLDLYYLWDERQWDEVKWPHSCVKQKETCPCRSYGVTMVSRSLMKWIRGNCGIWGSQGSEYEEYGFLGYDAMQIGRQLCVYTTTQCHIPEDCDLQEVIRLFFWNMSVDLKICLTCDILSIS
jgi:hypothetical protein